MSDRNYAIDMLKGLGMIFVVGGHLGSPFSGYYYSFHMGLFFFVSGYLMAYSNKVIDFKKYLYKKAVKILLPYIAFYLISFIVFEWRIYKSAGTLFPVESGHIKALFLGGGYLADYSINFPIWFFQTLFIAALCMFFIIKLNGYFKIIIFVLMFFLTVPFQTAVPGRPVFHINVLPAAIVYMLLGYGLNRLFDSTKRKLHVSFGIILIFVGWYMSRLYGGFISQIGTMYYYLGSFSTIIGLWSIVMNVKRVKVLEYIGERSMFILGIHALILEKASNFAEYIKASFGFGSDFIYHVFAVGIIVALCCSFADVIKIVFKYVKNLFEELKNELTKRRQMP